MWQNLILTISIYCTELQSSIGTNTLSYVEICHIELMVQCDRGLLVQAILWNSLSAVIPDKSFIKQSDIVPLGQATSVDWKWI